MTVDGKTTRELGVRVDPAKSTIAVDGEKIKLETMVYYAVNKPKGYVSTNDDPSGRPRVVDILAEVPERVYTVGRLDEESTGLMILTNDGELANRLAHPRYGVEKIYRAVVAGTPSHEILTKLSEGIWLSEGKARAKRSRIVGMQGEATILELVLAEGKKREIRRMLARLGHKVMSLTRVAIGPIVLKGLAVGEYRPLSRTEVDMLQKVAAGIPIAAPRSLDHDRAFTPGRGQRPNYGRSNQGAPLPRSRRNEMPEREGQRPRGRVEREEQGGPRPMPGRRPQNAGQGEHEGQGRPGPGPRPGSGSEQRPMPGRPQNAGQGEHQGSGRPGPGPGPGGDRRGGQDRRPSHAGQGQYQGQGRPGPGPGGDRRPTPGGRRPPHSGQGEHEGQGRPGPGDRAPNRGRRPEGPGAPPPRPGGRGGPNKIQAPPGLPPSKRRVNAAELPGKPNEEPRSGGRKIIGLDPKFTDHSSSQGPSSSSVRKRPTVKRLPPRKAHGVKRHKPDEEE